MLLEKCHSVNYCESTKDTHKKPSSSRSPATFLAQWLQYTIMVETNLQSQWDEGIEIDTRTQVK